MRFILPLLVLATFGPLALTQAQTAPHDHEKTPAKSEESNSDYFWRKSDEAFHAGDYERAVGCHRAIVALDPTDVESYSVASWLLWSMGKGAEAVGFIERGLKANPKSPEMWDAAGQHFDLQKRFADSQNAYAKAVELSGKDAPQMLRRRYAHAAQHAGDLNTSIAVWRALVTDFPNEAVNKSNLARVEKAQKEAAATPTSTAMLGGAGLLAALALRAAPAGRKTL